MIHAGFESLPGQAISNSIHQLPDLEKTGTSERSLTVERSAFSLMTGYVQVQVLPFRFGGSAALRSLQIAQLPRALI